MGGRYHADSREGVSVQAKITVVFLLAAFVFGIGSGYLIWGRVDSGAGFDDSGADSVADDLREDTNRAVESTDGSLTAVGDALDGAQSTSTDLESAVERFADRSGVLAERSATSAELGRTIADGVDGDIEITRRIQEIIESGEVVVVDREGRAERTDSNGSE